MAKRERVAKYQSFGKDLVRWRADRDIPTVVRIVKGWGAKLDEPTLRGWEYGWIASPDPVSLMALARLYDVDVTEMLSSLKAARKDAGQPINIPAPVPHPERVDARSASRVPGAIPPVDFVSVPLMSGRIAAGEPLLIDDGEYSSALAFRADFIRKKAKDPRCVRVGPREESMTPIITPNDVVLLDCADKEPTRLSERHIYAVRVDGGATLKRVELVKDKGRAWLVLMSDNPNKVHYATRFVPLEEEADSKHYIIGRVVWHGQYV